MQSEGKTQAKWLQNAFKTNAECTQIAGKMNAD
jgi:hypothetical protein